MTRFAAIRSRRLDAAFLIAWLCAITGLTLLYAARTAPGFWDVSGWSVLRNTSPLPGAFLLLVAVVSLAQGLRGVATPAWNPPQATVSWLTMGRWIVALAASAAATAILATANDTRVTPTSALILWLIGAVVVVLDPVALSDRSAWHERLRRLWVARQECAMVALLLVAAWALRAIGLERYPYAMVNDEGEVAHSAVCLLAGGCGNTNLFSTGWAGHTVLSFLTTASSIALFGQTAAAARLPNAFIGTLAILATYLFARRAFGRRVAAVAAILLTTLPVHVHFSRLVLINVSDSLFSAMSIWLLIRGMQTGSANSYVVAGAISGLALYGYQGGRLSMALGIGTVGWACLSIRRFMRLQGTLVVGYAIALLVVAMPIIGYFVKTPDDFMARLRLESIYHNGTVTLATPLAEHATLVVRNFFLSFLTYIATPALGGFFNSEEPHLPPIAAAAFVIGLGLIVARIRDTRHMALFAWFWAAVALVSTFTGSAPTHQRMQNSMPALVVMTAVGLVASAEQLDAWHRHARRLTPWLLATALAVISWQNLSMYFVSYNANHRWEDVRNELPYEAGLEIAAGHTPTRVYVIGAPVVYRVFANFDYFAPGIDKADFNVVTRETVDALPADTDLLFIAPPERRPALEQVAQLRPGGEWREARRRKQPDQILYLSYRLPLGR